jgi:hypothetical protein
VSSRGFSDDDDSRYANRSNDCLRGFYGLLKALNHTRQLGFSIMQYTNISTDPDRIALAEADKQMIAEGNIRAKDKPLLTLEEILENVRK